MENRESITSKLIATGLSGLIVLGGFVLIRAFISENRSADTAFQLDEKVNLSDSGSVVPKEVTSGARIGDTVVSPRVSPVLALSPSVSPRVSPLLSPMPSIAPIAHISPTITVSASPSSTPRQVSPMPSTLALSPSVSPTPAIVTTTPSPSVSPSVTPTPIPVVSPDQSAAHVVINEIAWMGTAADKNGSDEWIELYNSGNEDVNLSGWTLKSETDDSPHSTLAGTILANSYYLIERTNDDTIRDIKANFINSGGLKNDGEILTLQDKSGNIIDRVDCSKGWFYGDNTTKSSMERRDSNTSGSIRSNWATNNHSVKNGLDASGNLINGTPAHQNSVQI